MYEHRLESMAIDAGEYLEKHHIKEVMESIVIGMTIRKPRDPLEFIESCVKRIRDDDLISNHPNHERIRWSTFCPDEKPQLQITKSKGIVRRDGPTIPAINPYTHIIANPLSMKPSLPGIQPPNMKSKAWKNIVFVLGGPGSGKGTQCEMLARDYNYSHISIGDLLRQEVSKRTSLGSEIESLMKEGQMVASGTSIRLLKKAMHASDRLDGFLIDGFPRTLDQAKEFEQHIAKAKFAIYYECDEATLSSRLVKRGETSGRDDDNPETIQKRFRAFREVSMPVIEYFLADMRCVKINSAISNIEEVYEKSEKLFRAQPLYHKNIVFVLGGPGSGKGTQCAKLAREFNLVHLSTGDLLRDQVQQKTEIGLIASDLMKQGQMVPSSILMDMLRMKLEENFNANGFLIDGFPRSMDQALEFEQLIGPCRAVLAYKCSLDTLQSRLLERGKTSGRTDDNMESIQKRFNTFKEQSEPVIEYYKAKGKCTEIKSESSVDSVYEESRKMFIAPSKLNHPNIVFVLGAPGVGKGTISFMLVKEHRYKHISTGELLRKEVLKETQLGLQVQQYLANGKTAPIEIIFYLLKQEIAKNMDGTGILLDGFPANMEQALEFERMIAVPRAVISFTCPTEVLEERMLERGRSTGRSDDNAETIWKRLNVFKQEGQPVIDHYFKKGNLYEIDSNAPGREVFKKLISKFPVEVPIRPALIISGASGSGKSTLLNRLCAKYPGVFGYSVSHTTRPPRVGEQQGIHYNFVSLEEFNLLKDNDEFVETSEFSGNLYGTTFGAIRSVENRNKICLLDLEINGIKSLKERGVSGKFVFIRPPSLLDLEDRLKNRNTESAEMIAKRLEAAKEAFYYASLPGSYDLTVVNDSQDTAFSILEHYVEQVWKLQ